MVAKSPPTEHNSEKCAQNLRPMREALLDAMDAVLACAKVVYTLVHEGKYPKWADSGRGEQVAPEVRKRLRRDAIFNAWRLRTMAWNGLLQWVPERIHKALLPDDPDAPIGRIGPKPNSEIM